MHVMMVNVLSADGRLTKGDSSETHTWSSPEDWEEFVRLRDAQQAVVMGARTYDAAKPQPSAKLLRVILTHHPEHYASQTVPGQLEFIAATPAEVLEDLQGRGISRVMVAGGSQVNGDFLRAGLADDLYITYEPFAFGSGKLLASGEAFESKLQLVSARVLNKQGTILMHYRVLR